MHAEAPDLPVFDLAILGQVALSYSLFIDRERRVTATRLTVLPLRPSTHLDAAEFLEVVRAAWPADGQRVSLNVASESLLENLLATRPAPNVLIEIPSFMAGDPAFGDAIRSLHASGCELLLKGRPLREIPRDVLPCFAYAIIDLSEDRRVRDDAPPAGVQRRIANVQSGVRTRAEMEASFRRGNAAVLGWPVDEALPPDADEASGAEGTDTLVMRATDTAKVQRLIAEIDAEEPIERIEATLRSDPTLAWRLLRYLHSPSLGVQLEIASLRHAVMVLGHARLRRWLALLLTTAAGDAQVDPLAYAAVRRGLVMEQLARASGDEGMRDEMFLCGLFSLLDRMYARSFAALLPGTPVSDRVHEALVESRGPYHAYLDVLRAVESGSLDDFRRAAEQSMLGVAEINRALLHALVQAARDA